MSRAKRSLGGSNAYRYTGTPEPFYTLNVTMGTMPVAKLKEDAKRCGATVTEYLAAALIRTLIVVQHSERRRHEKPVALVVPVNLRPFFPTKTMRNFILTVRPCIDPELGDYTFEEIVQQVHHYMRLHLTRQELAAYLTKNVALQRSPLLRFVPVSYTHLAQILRRQRLEEHQRARAVRQRVEQLHRHPPAVIVDAHELLARGKPHGLAGVRHVRPHLGHETGRAVEVVPEHAPPHPHAEAGKTRHRLFRRAPQRLSLIHI